jgi:hypothetical protein
MSCARTTSLTSVYLTLRTTLRLLISLQKTSLMSSLFSLLLSNLTTKRLILQRLVHLDQPLQLHLERHVGQFARKVFNRDGNVAPIARRPAYVSKEYRAPYSRLEDVVKADVVFRSVQHKALGDVGLKT